MRASRAAWSIVVAAIAATGASGAGAAGSGSTALHSSPIIATFVPAKLETRYTVKLLGEGTSAPRYSWTLQLKLLDAAGAKYPTLPDSGATVDGKCTNRGVATSSTASFVWHHGEPPPDNCDHRKMGPSGHQGLITLTLTDGTTTCLATYRGTNTGVGSAAVCYSVPVAAGGVATSTGATKTTPASTETTAAETTTTEVTVTAGGSSGGGGGFPIVLVVLILLGAGGLVVGYVVYSKKAGRGGDETMAFVYPDGTPWYGPAETPGGDGPTPVPALSVPGDDDCPGLRRLCDEARARAEGAAAKAGEARRAAAAAEKASADARAAEGKAQTELDRAKAALHPAEGSSWVEDATTGERVTVDDTHAVNEAANAALQRWRKGEIDAQQLEDEWQKLANPGAIKKLRDQAQSSRQHRVDAAQKALADSTAARDKACSGVEPAKSAAAAADADAASLADAAATACAKADECEKRKATPPPPAPVSDGGATGGAAAAGTTPKPTVTDGPGAGGHPGTTATPPATPPPPKQPGEPCKEGATLEANPKKSRRFVAQRGTDPVHVVVTDLKDNVVLDRRYPIGLFAGTTPKELRGKVAGSNAAGAVNLYHLSITIDMVNLEYTCSEVYNCVGGRWALQGHVARETLNQEFTETLTNAGNLTWSEVQRQLKTSWPKLERIANTDDVTHAETFCSDCEGR